MSDDDMNFDKYFDELIRAQHVFYKHIYGEALSDLMNFLKSHKEDIERGHYDFADLTSVYQQLIGDLSD